MAEAKISSRRSSSSRKCSLTIPTCEHVITSASDKAAPLFSGRRRRGCNAGRNFSICTSSSTDHVPLIPDLYERMIDRLQAENADVLAFHLRRVDGTSDPHYLHHANETRFHDFFSSISRRADPEVVLAMLGTGSFWKREVFEAVTSIPEPFPIYFELYLPTLAHHLGYRLRDLAEQNAFVRHMGDFSQCLDQCRTSGAWTAHPVKSLSPEQIPDK